MAEEEPKTAPVESQEAQNTTMTEATTEGPSTTTESTEVPATAEAMDTSADNTEAKENDAALAGTQATTEVNAPDGEGKTEAAVLPSDVAEAATPTGNKNGKRKSTSGVPEHKSKKLNKKKSVAQLNLNINPGDYYWARLKGYSPWPSIVCDEDMLPEILLGNRPVSAKRADGSYREDYEDDGKNAKDRTYPVMFLGTNEFSWMVNTSLTKLEPGDCTPDKQTGKMSKALKEAYDIAEERHDLDYFKNMLDDFMQQQKQAQEEQAAKQAEKEAKAAKKAEKAAADKTKEKKDRRKSKSKETVSDADDMDLDVPEDAEAKPTKKRKKDADSEGEGPKPKKTPKATKVAATKTNGESAKKAAKPRKVVQKPADEEPATEAEKLERREKAVLYLRHRLQKGFLMRDQTPKEDEMSTMNDFFTQLEGYENLEPAIIRGTKIYKVLRGIIKLSSIPKEEEFQFKKRSNDLLALWHDALGSKGDEKEDEKTEDKDNGEKAEKPSEKPEEVAENTESKEPTEAPSNPEAAEDKDVAMTDVKEDKAEAAAAPAAQSETAAAE